MSSNVQKSVGAELAQFLPTNDKPWYRKSNLIHLNYCLISLFLLSSGCGYDGSMLNGVLALPNWGTFMNHPTGAWLGFVSGSQNLGAIFFYPVAAWLANRVGRKKTIYYGYAILFLGVGLQTGAVNSTMFVISRIVVGSATSFFAVSAPLLMTETAYPTQRAKFTALYLCGWYVGSFLAAWSTFGTRDYTTNWSWRIPSILQLVLPIAAVPGLLLMPESPRWLISNERHEEARAFLARFHAEGDDDSPLVAFQYAEITTSIRMENESQRTSSYKEMIKTPANRKRLFISIFLGVLNQWAGEVIAGYYLPPVLATIGITTVTQQTLINGFLQVWNLICDLTGAFNVDRVGRRVLFLTSITGMLISYILITALSATFAKSGSPAVGTAVVPFLFLMYGCFSLAFTPLVIAYPVEIWPYQLRSRGIATVSVSTSIAVFFNIFINPIALSSIGWKYYIVYVVILACSGLVIYFTFPETRGHSLEEMARVFGDADEKAPAEGVVTEKLATKGDGFIETLSIDTPTASD